MKAWLGYLLIVQVIVYQKEDWAFHRFACAVVAKRAAITKL